MKKMSTHTLISACILTAVSLSHAIDVGPGDISTPIVARGAGEIVDYRILGGTNLKTDPLTIAVYMQRGSLEIDGTLSPVLIEAQGTMGNNASCIYFESRSYGAGTLKISGDVTLHIPDTDAYKKDGTYALFIRGKLLAEGSDWVADLDGTTILVEADSGVGLAASDSKVRIRNADITTTKDGSQTNYSYKSSAIMSQASHFDIASTSITTLGDYGYGIFAFDSKIEGDDLTISTSGGNSHGLFLDNYYGNTYYPGTSATIKNSTITTAGDGSYGAKLHSPDNLVSKSSSISASFDGTSIKTAGSASHGVYMNNTNAVLNVQNGSAIETEGADSAGIMAVRGTATIEDSSVESLLSDALYAGVGGAINAKDSDISGATGLRVTDYQGAETTAAAANESSSVVIDGGSLTSTSGAAIVANNSNASDPKEVNSSITLKNGVLVSSSNGVIMDATDASSGIVKLNIKDSTDVTGAILSDFHKAYAQVSIDSTSSWTMDADSQVDGLYLDGKMHISAELTLRSELVLSETAELYWCDGAYIYMDCLDLQIDSGAKIYVVFDNYVEGATVIMADFYDFICHGLSDDANDYFVCEQGSQNGFFKFTDDNKLIFTFIPEPGVCGALFGLLAIAVAVCRRRK